MSVLVGIAVVVQGLALFSLDGASTASCTMDEARVLVESLHSVKQIKKHSPGRCFHLDPMKDTTYPVACFVAQKYCTEPNTGEHSGPTGVLGYYCVDRITLDVFENFALDKPVVEKSLEKARKKIRKKVKER